LHSCFLPIACSSYDDHQGSLWLSRRTRWEKTLKPFLEPAAVEWHIRQVVSVMTSYCGRMTSVFRGTLDVLSLSPGAHLPVKASHFHPQIPGLWAHPSRRSARNGVLPSLLAVRYSFILHWFPSLPAIVFLGLFGQPAPALQHGTASSLTFQSIRSCASAWNGVLPRLSRYSAVLLVLRVRSLCH